jgi:hypothetical protein
MKITQIFLIVFISCLTVRAAEMPNDRADKIADAIYKIENSQKWPYGIKSVVIRGNTQAERKAYARRICINTIKNNYCRWQLAGATNDFLVFLSDIYCPTKGNNLTVAERTCNKYWLSNLRRVLKDTYAPNKKM